MFLVTTYLMSLLFKCKLIFLLQTFVCYELIASLDCECGVPKVARGRIVGGTEASPGSYPWIAAFVDESGQTFCGGSLINTKIILTAAHCMQDREVGTFHAVLNQVDLTSPSPESIYNVQRIYIHPLFSGKPDFRNDLALVQLEIPVDIISRQSQISPICLPKEGPHVYGTLSVIGWGLVSNRGWQPMKLQEATVIQRSSNYCSKMYGPKFTSNHICANSLSSDVCNGDSGGPLMLRSRSQKYFLVGVVSFGYVCGYVPYPAVFTRPTEYLDWIFSTSGAGQYCTK